MSNDDDKPPEHLKQIVRMNPAMKPEGFTTNQAAEKLMDAMKEAKAFAAAKKGQGADSKTDAKPAPGAAPSDLPQAIASLEQRFSEENKALREQVSELEAQDAGLAGKVLERILLTILAHDPELKSPKTIEALKMKKDFLIEIGFSPEALAARRKPK